MHTKAYSIYTIVTLRAQRSLEAGRGKWFTRWKGFSLGRLLKSAAAVSPHATSQSSSLGGLSVQPSDRIEARTYRKRHQEQT